MADNNHLSFNSKVKDNEQEFQKGENSNSEREEDDSILKRMFKSLPSSLQSIITWITETASIIGGQILHNFILGENIGSQNGKLSKEAENRLSNVEEKLNTNNKLIKEYAEKEKDKTVIDDKKNTKENKDKKNNAINLNKKEIETILKQVNIKEVIINNDEIYFPDRAGKNAAILQLKDLGDAEKLSGALYNKGRPSFYNNRDKDLVKFETALRSCLIAAKINLNQSKTGESLSKVSYEASYGKMNLEFIKTEDKSVSLKVNDKMVINNVRANFLDLNQFKKTFRTPISEVVKNSAPLLKENHISNKEVTSELSVNTKLYANKEQNTNNLLFSKKNEDGKLIECGKIDLNKVSNKEDFEKAVLEILNKENINSNEKDVSRESIAKSITVMYCPEARNEKTPEISIKDWKTNNKTDNKPILEAKKITEGNLKNLSIDGEKLFKDVSEKNLHTIVNNIKNMPENVDFLINTGKENEFVVVSKSDKGLALSEPVNNLNVLKVEDLSKLSNDEIDKMEPLRSYVIVDKYNYAQNAALNMDNSISRSPTVWSEIQYDVQMKSYGDVYHDNSDSVKNLSEYIEKENALNKVLPNNPNLEGIIKEEVEKASIDYSEKGLRDFEHFEFIPVESIINTIENDEIDKEKSPEQEQPLDGKNIDEQQIDKEPDIPGKMPGEIEHESPLPPVGNDVDIEQAKFVSMGIGEGIEIDDGFDR